MNPNLKNVYQMFLFLAALFFIVALFPYIIYLAGMYFGKKSVPVNTLRHIPKSA